MMKVTTERRVLFLINPNSGNQKSLELIGEINKVFGDKPDLYQVVFVESKAHSKAVIESYKNKVDVVAAAGGDGTIHEVANSIVGTDLALGIIPKGSGNGIARHLNIPLNSRQAIKHIRDKAIKKIDMVSCNSKYFVGVGGTGFDAQVAQSFESLPHRGFWGYFKAVLKDLKTFEPKEVSIIADGGESFTAKTYLLSICNTAQYGNNAFISPNSSVYDGKMELCWIDPFPWINLPDIAMRFFTKKIGNSKYYHRISCKRIQLTQEQGVLHLDGEVISLSEKILEFNVAPKLLPVVH